MLQALRVSHFAIIDSLEIEFEKGLNILSGETGSGKSVLLKSLALLMGEKASSDTIRTGANSATVEGVFKLNDRPDLISKLESLGIETDGGELIVRRLISSEDKSKVFLNGVLCPLAQLREVVAPLIEVTGPQAPLIEMTGQHDNRNLLSKHYHLDLVDQFAGLWDKRLQYEKKFSQWTNLKNEIKDFEKSLQEKHQKLDFLKFQFSEFEKINPDPEKDQHLENEIQILKNTSKLVQFADLCDQVIYDDTDSISARLKSILKKSTEISAIDPQLAEKISGLEQALVLIDDSSYSLRQYVQKIDANPELLEEKESRLSQIRKLQKKYGEDLSALAVTFEKMESDIKALENSDQHLLDLKKQSTLIELDLKKIAEDLHADRIKAAKLLTTAVNGELTDLNMKGVTFSIQNTKLAELQLTGLSDIEFFSRTSPKDPERPIAKVSSGGELSRILLALKKSVGFSRTSKKHLRAEYPRTYLFDEVDTGVSGPTAEKVGKKLKEIAQGQQVICVTHLPQVAAFGDIHFSIQKTTMQGHAVMNVHSLSKKERVEEIARLISGEKISKTSLAHAEQLLKETH